MAPTPSRAGAGIRAQGAGGGDRKPPEEIQERQDVSEAYRIEHLTQKLVERESLVVALQRKLREREGPDFVGPGQSTLRSLTKNLDKRRGQIAKLVLDHEISKTEFDWQLQELENEIHHLRTKCDAEQARAVRAEAQVEALSMQMLSIEKAHEGIVTMQQQVECILQDQRSLQSELASCLAAQPRHREEEKKAGGRDDVASRLNTRAQAGYLILGARNERAQNAEELATQRLAEQTMMTERAQAEVHRLAGVVSHLNQQLSERKPHAPAPGINHERRRSALVKLEQLEGASCDGAAAISSENGRSAAVSSRREGSDGAGEGKNPGDDSGDGESKTKSRGKDVTDLLVEVKDDFLFTQLIHARVQVQVLTQECTELRAQQVLEDIPAAAQPKSNGDASTDQLKEKLVAVSEELHDAKMALKAAESQAAFMKSDLEDAEERCRRATHEAQLAKSNTLKNLLPSGSETELRAQIADLTSVRERLDSRIKVLESQSLDAKTSHKSLHQMLLTERKLHHNTALIKNLREQVETLTVRVKGAEADPLQLLVGYNGMISEDSDRSLSSRTAIVEREKCKRYSDLRKTAESFQTQLRLHLKALYHQKAETATSRNQKFALEKELLACREHLAKAQKTVTLLEGNAEARADEIRPLLRAARLELVRRSFDLANLNCKRQPEAAFVMWERGLSILEEIQEGKVADWAINEGDDMAFFHLEPTEIASVHQKMGMLLLEKKDMLAAKAFFHKAFEARVEHLGDEHIQTKKSQMWLRRCTAERANSSSSDDSDALGEADVLGAEAPSPLAHRRGSPTVSFASSNASSPEPPGSLLLNSPLASGSFDRPRRGSYSTSTKSLDLGSELGLHVVIGPGDISSVGEAERAFTSALKVSLPRVFKSIWTCCSVPSTAHVGFTPSYGSNLRRCFCENRFPRREEISTTGR